MILRIGSGKLASLAAARAEGRLLRLSCRGEFREPGTAQQGRQFLQTREKRWRHRPFKPKGMGRT